MKLVQFGEIDKVQIISHKILVATGFYLIQRRLQMSSPNHENFTMERSMKNKVPCFVFSPLPLIFTNQGGVEECIGINPFPTKNSLCLNSSIKESEREGQKKEGSPKFIEYELLMFKRFSKCFIQQTIYSTECNIKVFCIINTYHSKNLQIVLPYF